MTIDGYEVMISVTIALCESRELVAGKTSTAPRGRTSPIMLAGRSAILQTRGVQDVLTIVREPEVGKA